MGPRSRRSTWSTRSTRCGFAPGGRLRRWLLPGRGGGASDAGGPEVSGWAGGRGPAAAGPVLPRELGRTGGGAPRRSPRTWTAPSRRCCPARPRHPGPPRRTAAPPGHPRRPAVDRPVWRPGDHRAAAPLPDPAAAPTQRHHRPLPHPGPHHPGVPARRVLDIGLAPGTSSNSLTGHPAEQVLDLLHQPRKHRIPVLRAGGHSPGTAGNTTTHDDPPHDNPVPPVPRVDGGRMPAPGTDRTPPASGRPVVHHGGAGTGRRCPPPG